MRAVALAWVILLAGCVADVERPPAAAPGPQLLGTATSFARGETAVGVAPDDTTIVAYIGGLGKVLAWAGPAAGGTLAPVEGPDGPGDADLASAASGVHWIGLLGEAGRLPAQRWANGSWTRAAEVSGGSRLADRPFLDAEGDVVLAVWNGQTDGVQAALSRDGGTTWSAPSVVTRLLSGTHGGAAVGPRGELAATYASDPLGVQVALSTDGVSWNAHRVALETSWAWPSVAIDGDGAIHVVWTSTFADGVPATARAYGGEAQPAPHVRYARSDDGGATWSTPRELTESGHAGYYPWMDARDGRVVVAWYDVEIGANDGNARVELAFLDGDDMTRATPTPDPVPLGMSCESALRCREQGPVGESFDVALRADGSAAIAWLQAGSETEVWYAAVAP